MKPIKSSLTRKLDIECSRIVRARGGCAWCFKSDYSSLQCAHIFSRTYRNTRWNLNNLICLCASCHFLAHREPVEFTEFVRNYLGSYNYEQLRLQHNAIKRYTLQDMIDLLTTLQSV